MKKMNLQNKILIGLLLVICLLIMIGLGVGAATTNYAIEDSNSKLLKDVEVEDDTVLVGTHLIHVKALTTPVYRIALKSQSVYGQYQIYYKSALLDGAWVEVSDIDSIDSMVNENTVDEETIKMLKVAYETGADGKTVHLATGKSISIYDIDNPIDVENYSELSSLKDCYLTMKKKTKKTSMEEQCQKVMLKLFEKMTSVNGLSTIEDEIDGLVYYKGRLLNQDKSHEYVEMTDCVIEQSDAKRRIAAYGVITERLKSLDKEISAIENDKKYKSVSENNSTFEVCSQLHTYIASAKAAIEESKNYYNAFIYQGDVSVCGKVKTKYMNHLLEAAKGRDTDECELSVRRLCNLEHILSGKLIDRTGEKALIKNELIVKAKELYKEALTEGEGEEFARTEYQIILAAYFERMDNEKARNYVLDFIDGIESFRKLAKEESGKDSVEQLLLFLEKSYTSLVKEAYGESEISDLYEQLEQLKLERENALEEENIELANSIKIQIDEIQNQIDEINEKMLDILADDQSSEREKAKAQAALMEHSSASIMNALSDSICLALGYVDQTELRKDKLEEQLDEINRLAQENKKNSGKTVSGNSVSNNSVSKNSVSTNRTSKTEEQKEVKSSSLFSVSENNLEILKDTKLDVNIHTKIKAYTALAQLDPEAAQATVKKIQRAFSSTSCKDTSLTVEIANMLSKVEYAIATAPEKSDLTAEEFARYWEEADTNKEKATVLLALLLYGEKYDDDQAVRLAGSFGTMAGDNPYLFNKYDKKAGEYVSLKTIAYVKEMRYLYVDGKYQAYLQKEEKSYFFDHTQKEVKISGENVMKLSKNPVLGDDLYISGEDARELFQIDAYYLNNSDKAIAYSKELKKSAKLLMEQMANKEGYEYND